MSEHACVHACLHVHVCVRVSPCFTLYSMFQGVVRSFVLGGGDCGAGGWRGVRQPEGKGSGVYGASNVIDWGDASPPPAF